MKVPQMCRLRKRFQSASCHVRKRNNTTNNVSGKESMASSDG